MVASKSDSRSLEMWLLGVSEAAPVIPAPQAVKTSYCSIQLGEEGFSAALSHFFLRSSFILNVLAEELIWSQAPVITISCFSSSLGCGDSCIFTILSMQQGNFLARRYPAFISCMESPTTIKLVTKSVRMPNISCNSMNFLIFQRCGGAVCSSPLD